MATGRIRRNARRGVAAAALAWLSLAAAAIALAPAAGAAPAVTIEIKNLTPPVASVDPGGTVTFVNKIPAENTGGISIPLPLGRSVSVGATVFTDVTVDFFGQPHPLKPEESVAWAFSDPATPGWITYTYRVVPQATLPLGVTAQQVIDRTLASLPPLPAPIPYVVQTVAPGLPNLPSIGLPPLPQLTLPLPSVALPGTPAPGAPLPTGPDGVTAPPAQPQPGPGAPYVYPTDGGAQLSPRNGSAAAAFDPSRFLATGNADSNNGSGTPGGALSGSGGLPGGYDGATVPVFGQLAGLNGTALDEESAQRDTTADTSSSSTLPAAALAAVVALAAVTAALVRTHQASRAGR